EVLRREMRQAEGAWISTTAIERSKTRLERLAFFDEINVETPAVPGTNDQVDVNFTVKEKPAGNLLLGAGFSQAQGIVIQTSITQENFAGSGNRASFAFNNSRVNRNFSFSWFNPYWTDDGISRGLEAFYRKTDAFEANLADYNLDELGAGISFGVPISEFNTVNFGATIENTKFKPGDTASNEVVAFRNEVGEEYNTLTLGVSHTNDTRDNRLLPNRGQLTRISADLAVPGLDLSFYKLRLLHQRVLPLFKDFALALEGDVGYGDGYGSTRDLPLTKNYFAGGLRSVRGFEANTLGPRDSNGEPLGGSVKLVGNAELIIPLPFVTNTRSFRLTAFLDGGNVYGPGEDVDLETIRYSTGISAVWLSPLGPMTVSIAVPLKEEPGDETQPFQFTFGTTF
ncbi:MAG TPA: outer membrane protein assembly factor BamA, partial [Gammaproteobacteria bacterium]|nr:outer membrane protein assembly factor BamA [Gammaproteobacteria bacterium]